MQQTVAGFARGKAIDPSELEEFLGQYLESNFNTEADDDSPKEVGQPRVQAPKLCFQECCKLNPGLNLYACRYPC